jgi:acetyl-CoA carboxylase alpha subunit
MGEALRQCLLRQLRELEALDTTELLRRRGARLQSYGSFREG